MKKRKDCIYYYYFEQTHSIYVGRTIQRTERNWQHIHCVKTDTVARYSYENGFQVPEMVIIEDNLTVEQGQKQECFWMDFYKKHGYNLLNKCKGGATGGLGSGKLTKEYCLKEAKQYKTKKEFERKSKGAYQKSMKMGWLDEMDWFDIKRKRWTYEECYEIAKQCQTKTDFQNTNNGAYLYALRNKWLKDYTWFENGYEIMGQNKTIWTYEKCEEEALKYKTKKDFREKSPKAYGAAHKYKWIDSFTHFSNGRLNHTSTSKKIEQYTIDGQLIKVYPSVQEAERQTGINHSSILTCCKGGKFDKKRNKWVNTTHAHGYIWKYAS